MTEKFAQPKCPECKVEGLKHIYAHDSEQEHGSGDAWFQVATCLACGHVYGVFAKITNSITPSHLPFPR